MVSGGSNMAKCRILCTLVLVLTVAFSQVSCQSNSQQAQQQQDINKVEWWKKTVFYHIYLRSFKDSNGDGQGDLRGLIQKLDYLQWLGVETLLTSPFYKSPMKDGGYDIEDYEVVDPLFGTMQDFDELVAELKKRQMRIVIDFVPNHTSKTHKWFECSEKALIEPERCGKYKDYYVWTSRKRFNGTLPSNWASRFGDEPAWTWSPIREQFYLHQFLSDQPDLNLRSELVREDLKQVARFWLAKGVDGLRIDAVTYLLEDTFNMPDLPSNPDWTPDMWPSEKLWPVPTTVSFPGSPAIVADWRKIAKEEFSGDRVIIDEAYDLPERLVNYHGTSPDDRFADMVFGFNLQDLRHNATMTPSGVEMKLRSWFNTTRGLDWPDERGTMVPWISWLLGCHDQPRAVLRIGESNLAFYHFLGFLVPGVPINYYGDEIGTNRAEFSQIPNRTLNEGLSNRLVERALMAWQPSGISAGFSSSGNVWMPLPPDYMTHNVETMRNSSEYNHLRNFRRIVELRKDRIQTVVFGEMDIYQSEPAGTSMIFAMVRQHNLFGSLLLLANLNTKEAETVNLIDHSLHKYPPPVDGEILLMNREFEETRELVQEGKIVLLAGLTLGPSQALVLSFPTTNK